MRSSPEAGAATAPKASVWAEYKANPTTNRRNEIAMQHSRLVGHAIISARVPPDLIPDASQAAYIGLLEAVEAFDESKGVAFGSFAFHRVRGAVIDFLRSHDRTP